MFNTVLIANRGEIACRISKTTQRLGITSIAVYSSADAMALHRQRCDVSVAIGDAAASASYLQQQRIIDAALEHNADAVHPGYGFLSENAEFADACDSAGLVFIGPSATNIRAMGSKSQARQLVSQAGVPVVPGYDGAQQDASKLSALAEDIGFPLLIKASAGGGGKGMRIVESAADFASALASVKRESLAAFADDHVILEHYVSQARHVEVQIFADNHGNVVHLFDRDCSLQRRHQKVIEEAPAPFIDDRVRADMQQSAIQCARAIDYRGAGTIEFLLTPAGRYYFMEMNTRLQVEHPVTEAITGQDLVEWQLRIAAGERLPVSQQDITCHGHAIEARVYAENPDQDFLPASGQLHALKAPSDAAIRVDSGVSEGDEIGVFYDPMIAKVISHESNREQALRRLQRACMDYQVIGLQHNLGFLQRLLGYAPFAAGKLHTRLIADAGAELLIDRQQPNAVAISAALLIRQLATTKTQVTNHSHSPWQQRDGWQLGTRLSQPWQLHNNTQDIYGHITYDGETRIIAFNDHTYRVKLVDYLEQRLRFDIDGERYIVTGLMLDEHIYLQHRGDHWHFTFIDARIQNQQPSALGSLNAPMPGNVVAVNCTTGDIVEAGDVVMILEAMKMEQAICAPYSGTIDTINFKAGDQVQEGDALLVITAHDAIDGDPANEAADKTSK